MLVFLKKIFEKKCLLTKAIGLLEQCARDGDIRAQQMLSMYKSSQSSRFSPLQDNVSALQHADIMKCIKKPKTSVKKARNPLNSSAQGRKNAKSKSKTSRKTKAKSN